MNAPLNDSPRLSSAVRYAELAARSLELPFRLLDDHSGYLCEIGKGSRSLLLGAGTINSWPLNSAGAATLASDKAFTARVLSDRGILTPKSESLFLSARYSELRAAGRERDVAPALAASLGWPIIAKPNNGSRGAFVQLCYDEGDLQLHLSKMEARYDIAILQEYIEGSEYRVFVFEGDAVFSYKKHRATLTADACKTIYELIIAHNLKLERLGLDPIDPRARVVTDRLSASGLRLDDIAAKGVEIDVGIRANLAAGGVPEEFSTEVPSPLARLALNAAAALGLAVAGVDIICRGAMDRDPLYVLEVNSNPTISSLEAVGRLDLAASLYKRMIRRMLGI